MSSNAWRNTAIVLAVLSVFLWWRGNHRVVPAAAAAPAAASTSAKTLAAASGPGAAARAATAPDPDTAADPEADPDSDPAATDDGASFFGLRVPAWARWFAPQPGEDLGAYRDRVMPFVEAAVAPQRARVDRALADFDAAAHLDDRQHAELDAAVADAGSQIEDRVMNGVMSGELSPAQVKPSTAVAFARDILNTVDGADRRFEASLTDDQRAVLADHGFDVADYLLFSVRWEEMLGFTPPEARR